MESKNVAVAVGLENEVTEAIIKSRASEEQREVMNIFIEGLEHGLKIEKDCYEKSRACLEHLRTIHDGVLAMKETAGKVLEAWRLTKDDRDFNPTSFPGGREGMQMACFCPMEAYEQMMPKIAKVFEYDADAFLAPYVQNIRDLNDAIGLFKKGLEIDDLVVELQGTEPNRRKAVLRKMFRTYKEYIGMSPGILYTKFKSPNVPEEKTEMVYQLVKRGIEDAKVIVEGLRKVI